MTSGIRPWRAFQESARSWPERTIPGTRSLYPRSALSEGFCRDQHSL